MFTVKVVRLGADGRESVHLYRARNVSTHWDPDNPTMRAVSWIEADSGDETCVCVGSELPIERDEMRPVKVFIENEHGRTTEVVR